MRSSGSSACRFPCSSGFSCCEAAIKKKALAVVVLALIALRLYLPTLVRDYANRQLDRNLDYRGRIDKVGISLWRGAYQLKGLKLEKLDGPPVAFVSCERVDFSIEWKALLRGSVIGKIALHRPVVNLVKGTTADRPSADPVKAATAAKSQTQLDKGWEQTLKDLMPLTIDRLVVEDGEVHYRDFGTTPQVDLMLSKISVVATNLSNVKQRGKLLPTNVKVLATCFDSGTLDLQLSFDPLAKEPTFELKETLEGVKLVKLNDFFEAYGKFRVKDGEFGLYTEIAAKGGAFSGYTKPFFRDVAVEERGRKGMRKVWAGIASAAARLLSNPKADQVATKIPLKGTFAKTDVGVWTAVGGLLKNAFIQALMPTLDGTVHIADVPPVKK